MSEPQPANVPAESSPQEPPAGAPTVVALTEQVAELNAKVKAQDVTIADLNTKVAAQVVTIVALDAKVTELTAALSAARLAGAPTQMASPACSAAVRVSPTSSVPAGCHPLPGARL